MSFSLIVPARRFAMKVSVAILCFASLASSTVPASRQTADSEVLVARGVLSRNGKAGTLWILKTNNSLKFRDEAIVEVTFTTKTGEASLAYAAYEGKEVELTGEVKEVFHGNAVLSKVRTIGILDLPVLSAYAQIGILPSPASQSLNTLSQKLTPANIPVLIDLAPDKDLRIGIQFGLASQREGALLSVFSTSSKPNRALIEQLLPSHAPTENQ